MASKFQQRHYEAVARVLYTMKPDPGTSWGRIIHQWGMICCQFEFMFRQDNPKFRTDTFFKACGYKEDDQ